MPYDTVSLWFASLHYLLLQVSLARSAKEKGCAYSGAWAFADAKFCMCVSGGNLDAAALGSGSCLLQKKEPRWACGLLGVWLHYAR